MAVLPETEGPDGDDCAEASSGGGSPNRWQALLCVCEHLDARDLAAMARTCREWHGLSREPGFWSRLDLRGLASAERALVLLGTPKFSQATMIAIQFCDALLDSHLALFPPTLRELVLDACHSVTDAGLETVAVRCRELRKLSLYWNNNVSDKGVVKVALFCKQLVDLSLSGCHRVTSTGTRCAQPRRLSCRCGCRFGTFCLAEGFSATSFASPCTIAPCSLLPPSSSSPCLFAIRPPLQASCASLGSAAT